MEVLTQNLATGSGPDGDRGNRAEGSEAFERELRRPARVPEGPGRV